MVTHEMLDSGVDAIATLDACGLSVVMPLTGMLTAGTVAAAPGVPGLELTVPQDDRGCAAILDVNSLAYGMDLAAGKAGIGSRAFWKSHFPVVAVADGKPVSCAAVLMVDGHRYVALVATEPGQQRRGFADAAMRRALQNAAAAHGETPTVLHASDAGRPVYERMGYTSISTHTLFMEKRFLEDLYYRLNVIQLVVAPLRERAEDIPMLMAYFLHKHATRNGRSIEHVDHDVVSLLQEYHWPGNVRELENVMERAVVLSSGQRIGTDLIPEHVRSAPQFHIPRFVVPPEGISFKDVITDVEKRLIESTLEAAGGVQKKAAGLLRIKPTTLNEMIKRYDIDRQRRKGGPEEEPRSGSRARTLSGAEVSHE